MERGMEHIRLHKPLKMYFHNKDFIDIKTIAGKTSLRRFISGMLSYYPWWLILLYRIREILVRIFGLARHGNPGRLPSIQPKVLSFKTGERASFFIVRDAKENAYWVSETPEDKHLKAFFGVAAEEMDHGLTRFYVFTTVNFIHWTGPVYFNIIRPFHHLVVNRMMRAGMRY
jgi:hypothetical protein